LKIWTAVPGALLCCQLLAVLALRRIWRLALHPGTAAQISNLIPPPYLADDVLIEDGQFCWILNIMQ
jgi:hypothetical protein